MAHIHDPFGIWPATSRPGTGLAPVPALGPVPWAGNLCHGLPDLPLQPRHARLPFSSHISPLQASFLPTHPHLAYFTAFPFVKLSHGGRVVWVYALGIHLCIRPYCTVHFLCVFTISRYTKLLLSIPASPFISPHVAFTRTHIPLRHVSSRVHGAQTHFSQTLFQAGTVLTPFCDISPTRWVVARQHIRRY